MLPILLMKYDVPALPSGPWAHPLRLPGLLSVPSASMEPPGLPEPPLPALGANTWLLALVSPSCSFAGKFPPKGGKGTTSGKGLPLHCVT